MRIGIITFFAPTNFGAILQAFSSYHFLKDNGFDPVIINYYRPDTDKILSTYNQEQIKLNEKFIHENLTVTKRILHSDELPNTIDDYKISLFWFGSDAIWSFHNDDTAEVFLVGLFQI